jgi:hypothetical protein
MREPAIATVAEEAGLSVKRVDAAFRWAEKQRDHPASLLRHTRTQQQLWQQAKQRDPYHDRFPHPPI